MSTEAELREPHLMNQILPIRMTSRVVRGYGRGSKELGIPTANLDTEQLKLSKDVTLEEFPTGIYWGVSRIADQSVYTAAVSVGYNPTYGNDTKTIEPHLIAPEHDPRRHASSTGETLLKDFYDQTCRLSLVGYMRPELPFEGLDKLIEAIKGDIAKAVQLGNEINDTLTTEKEWVQSDEPARG
ncbi:riboflavin kinase [Fistulifera solaris]|uniref:riboflavin kinase n=1 Tax=Fistulifera solaris TaxID=1519565 RepID=A0A1Z5K185_FISSO|nr:riboflavin kinase [Fistulifera solaris]|eukprot:GAX19929.1 riboflavin kinase [Fistulifera solaris]